MRAGIKRRSVLAGLLAGSAGGALLGRGAGAAGGELSLGPPEAFDFEALTRRAEALSRERWDCCNSAFDDVLDKIDYDAYQKIRFRPAATLWPDSSTPIQFFHLGKYVRAPVQLFALEAGSARQLRYSAALFDMPQDHVARSLPGDVGFAGFRVMAKDLKTDWLAFLGHSYFRSSGPFDQYGLSARGLAIDPGLPKAEEFPYFTKIWLEKVDDHNPRLIVLALLESPSATGAFRFDCIRAPADSGVVVAMDVEARLFARGDIPHLAIAPMSSMFWYGKGLRSAAVDWRPEIHDSDGLAMWTGKGERIWRPLNNAPRVITSTFADEHPRGFGLLQRERNFLRYMDDGVFYDRRPAVWIEPVDDWGRGSVHLLEIPTDDEVHDNIAVYWVPEGTLPAGSSRRFRYRLSWLADIDSPIARVVGRWFGPGGTPRRPIADRRKVVVDFEGTALAELQAGDPIEFAVTASRGEIFDVRSVPMKGHPSRWRAMLEVAAGPAKDPVELRGYLRRGETALSETWVDQYFPA